MADQRVSNRSSIDFGAALAPQAPVSKAQARQELQAVRMQLQGLDGNRDVQVKLLLDDGGTLRAVAAHDGDQDGTAAAEEKFIALLEQAHPGGAEAPPLVDMQRETLIHLIDRYRQPPPASGKTFHGAKAVYGTRPVPAPQQIAASELQDFVRDDQINERALAALTEEMGNAELPDALKRYLTSQGGASQDLHREAHQQAERLAPAPKDEYGFALRRERVLVRGGSERPGGEYPLERIAFDFENFKQIEAHRAVVLNELHLSGALTPERLGALKDATSIEALNNLKGQAEKMASVQSYLAPRRGRSLGKSVEHLFFKMASTFSSQKSRQLASARIARSLADVVGSARLAAQQPPAQARWRPLSEALGKLSNRVNGSGAAGAQELDTHLDALLDRIVEVDEAAHLGQPQELRALSEALQMALRELPGAQPNAGQSMDLLQSLTEKVSERLAAYQGQDGAGAQAQAGQDRRIGQVRAGMEQALGKLTAKAQWSGLLEVCAKNSDLIEEGGLAGLLPGSPAQPNRQLQEMLRGLGALDQDALAQMRTQLTQQGRVGLLFMNSLRLAAGGPLSPQSNQALNSLLPPSAVLAALSQENAQARTDWSAWVDSVALGHSGMPSAIAQEAAQARTQAMRQGELIGDPENFLQVLHAPGSADRRAGLREEGDFLQFEQSCLERLGREIAPQLPALIAQAAQDLQNLQNAAPSERAQIRDQLERDLVPMIEARQGRFDDQQVAGLTQAALAAVQTLGLSITDTEQRLADLMPQALALRSLTALSTEYWPDSKSGLGEALRLRLTRGLNPVKRNLEQLRSAQNQPSTEAIEALNKNFERLQGLLLGFRSIPDEHPLLKDARLPALHILAEQFALGIRSTARQLLQAHPNLEPAQRQSLEKMSAHSGLPALRLINSEPPMPGPDGLGLLQAPLSQLLADVASDRPIDTARRFGDRLMLAPELRQALAPAASRERTPSLVAALESVWHWDPAQGQKLIDALPAATLREHAAGLGRADSPGPALAALKLRLASARTQALEALDALALELEEPGDQAVPEGKLGERVSSAFFQAQSAYELRSVPSAGPEGQQAVLRMQAALTRIGVAIKQRTTGQERLWPLENNLSNTELGLLRMALTASGSLFTRDGKDSPLDDALANVSQAARYRLNAAGSDVRDMDSALGDLNDYLQRTAHLNSALAIRQRPLQDGIEQQWIEVLEALYERLSETLDEHADLRQELADHISEPMRETLLPTHQDTQTEQKRRSGRDYLLTGPSMRESLGKLLTRQQGELLKTIATLEQLNPKVRDAVAQLEDQYKLECSDSPAPPSSLLMLELIQALRLQAPSRLAPASAEALKFQYKRALTQLIKTAQPGGSQRISLQDWQDALFDRQQAYSQLSAQERADLAQAQVLDVVTKGEHVSYRACRTLLKSLPAWRGDAGVSDQVYETLQATAKAAESGLNQALLVDTTAMQALQLINKEDRSATRAAIDHDLRILSAGKVLTHTRTEVEPNQTHQLALGGLGYLRKLQAVKPDAISLMSDQSLSTLASLLSPLRGEVWTIAEEMRAIEAEQARRGAAHR